MRVSIRTLLTVPFLVLTLVPASIVGWLFQSNSQKAVRGNVKALFGQVSERTSEQIKLYLATPHFINQVNYNAIELGLIDIDAIGKDISATAKIEEYFVKIFRAASQTSQDTDQPSANSIQSIGNNGFTGSINHIYIGTATGFFRGAENRPRDRGNLDSERIIAISRGETALEPIEENGEIKINPNTQQPGHKGKLSQVDSAYPEGSTLGEPSDYDLFNRPWYTKGVALAKSSESTGWSQPYCDKTTKTPAITAVRPINRNGELRAVLGSDFLFSDIREFLQYLLSSANVSDGYILVLNDKNELLISASGGGNLDEQSPQNQAVRCDPDSYSLKLDKPDGAIGAILNALRMQEVGALETSKKTLELQNITTADGKRYFVRYSPIQDDYGLKLSLWVVIPEEVFLGEINASTNYTLFLCGLTVLTTGILGLLIARWITQPVLTLEKAAQELAQSINEPESSSSIVIENPSELHMLANTFGSMSIQLKKTFIAFGRFVPQNFLKALNLDNATQVELGLYNTVDMTILFSDIRSFTKLSEDMKPEENFKFINSYLSYMEPAIGENDGFIDKYIGDGIMALFEGNISPDNAVKAALSMLQRLGDFNATRNRENRKPIKIGIGIHTGTIILGTLGGSNRWDTTVIGRDVNRASRVEGLTKDFGAGLLVSQETLDRLQHTYHHRYLGAAEVRGIKELVEIHEIYEADPHSLLQFKVRTKADFQAALAAYKEKDYPQALERFKAIVSEAETTVSIASVTGTMVSSRKADGAAWYYLRKCQEHLGLEIETEPEL